MRRRRGQAEAGEEQAGSALKSQPRAAGPKPPETRTRLEKAALPEFFTILDLELSSRTELNCV
jgi:hypothetical protein